MTVARQPPELIGQAPAFLDALAHASSAAQLDRPLLVVGERGAGKELIAERIHFLSPRWEGPLLKINCAAMNEELLESELFGHEAGAFTGAQKRHVGRFERAAGGTLFLDEIPSASLRVQEKLLRVIEYGEFERVGGEATLLADVRIVAASNADLPARAAAGRFRADLLDRLAFDVIQAPPLRARKEDIPLLAAHFASLLARELAELDPAIAFAGFTPDAMKALVAHDWPGNVRELKNAAERSFYRWVAAGRGGAVDAVMIDPFAGAGLTGPEAIESPALPEGPSGAEPPAAGAYNLRAALDAVEREWTLAALAANGWSQKRAAAHLSLTYDQIRGLVRKHAIKAPPA